MSYNNSVDATHTLIDQAALSADAAVQTTQRLATQAVDGVANTVQTVRQQVRDGANLASDKTVAYIREAPVKSVLIAAVTGAALLAVAHVVMRPNSTR